MILATKQQSLSYKIARGFTEGLGISALALTGPGARAHLEELPTGVRVQDKLTPRGFLALELDL